MTQADRKIEDYGNEMKKAVDALRDVGQAVSPSTLLLNLLRGLNSRYSTTTDIIVGTAGMTFATALDQLKLKELRLENKAKVEATNALVASSSSGCSGANFRPPSRSQQSLPSQQQPQQGAGGSLAVNSSGRAMVASGANATTADDPTAAAVDNSSLVPPSLLARGFALIRRPSRGHRDSVVVALANGVVDRVYFAPTRRPMPPTAPLLMCRLPPHGTRPAWWQQFSRWRFKVTLG
jgi:hypothetical protein